MRPPCISTRRLTTARPMPSPPCDRSSERSTCVNSSKTLGSISAEECRCRCPPRGTRPPSRRARRKRCIDPPPRVYFAALLSRFESTCDNRTRSHLTQSVSSGMEMVNSCPASSMRGRLVLQTAVATIAATSIQHLQLEPDFAPGNPRDIEEIVHESHELRRLTIDHIARPRYDLGLFIAPAFSRHRPRSESGPGDFAARGRASTGIRSFGDRPVPSPCRAGHSPEHSLPGRRVPRRW